MKRILFLVVAVLPLFAVASTGVSKNELGLTVYTEEVATPAAAIDQIESMLASEMRDDAGIVSGINEIVNLGDKIWKLIEKNKPVLNTKNAYANAVPRGVKSPEELENFTPMQYKSFRKYAKNSFGSTVFDLTYVLAHRYNGQLKGAGRFLDAVTVLPHKVDVMWGYTVNFGVTRVSTANLGSEKEAIGAVVMELDFNVSTILKASQYKNLYEFRGDSARVTSIEN